jgi:hypothetical protein
MESHDVASMICPAVKPGAVDDGDDNSIDDSNDNSIGHSP